MCQKVRHETAFPLSTSVSSAQTQHQVQRRLLLNVIIRQSAPILQLLTRENQTLLLGRDTLLILNLRLHIQSDGLSRQSLDENLHRTAAQAQHQMQSRLFLSVIVAQRTPILQLLSRENEALLLGRNALLVLNLGLHVLDRIIRLHVERDRPSREGLDEDLHRTTAQTEDEVQRRLLLNVIIREGSPILELFARENQTLLLGRDSLLILNL